jgi:pimeloyl-ACP methyl ester carboxylesterase
MKIESGIGLVAGGILAGSMVMAQVRFSEENARRHGLKGTAVMTDRDGRDIEYLHRPSALPSRGTILFENGLGDPLEVWDWICTELAQDFDTIRYHRSGYFRTTSKLRPGQIVQDVLEGLAPSGPVYVVAHSIGALVAANWLSESPELMERIPVLVIVDGTDADLLSSDRTSHGRAARFKQATWQQVLSAVTGMDRWTPNKIQRDVEYRPDIQQAFVTSLSNPKAKLTSVREYLGEPLEGQSKISRSPLRKLVIGSEENSKQQLRLAKKYGAGLVAVPASTHRSIIGSPVHARTVAAAVREGLN